MPRMPSAMSMVGTCEVPVSWWSGHVDQGTITVKIVTVTTTAVTEDETVVEMTLIGIVPDQDRGLGEGGLVPDPETETTIRGDLVPGTETMVGSDLDPETETTIESDPVPGTEVGGDLVLIPEIGGDLVLIPETGTMTGGDLVPVPGAKRTFPLLKLLLQTHTAPSYVITLHMTVVSSIPLWCITGTRT